MEPQPPQKPTMKVSWETMKENHVPLHLRDYCAHVLIPLNRYDMCIMNYNTSLIRYARCRRKEGPFPWTCHDEKHAYEVCQYEIYQYRIALKEYLVSVGQWNNGRFPEAPNPSK